MQSFQKVTIKKYKRNSLVRLQGRLGHLIYNYVYTNATIIVVHVHTMF